MNTRKFVSIGLVGALLAGTTLATASDDTGAVRRAAASAKQAEKAIGKHKADKAVAAAENAVALQPNNARYRALLGEAYLTAGRFTSAAGAFSDSLSLDPSSGAAALHLTLAQIGTGDWSAARATLERHKDSIAPTDRGLAVALAGDPATAVGILTEAARQPGATAKTRQNLALALALAGRWPEAKSVAEIDVAPSEIDARIVQWAAFARPTSASDQVATLLGVKPVADGGQPERLALRSTAPTMAAVAQTVDPVEAFMPTQDVAAVEATPVPVVGAQPAVVVGGVKFAERREIVQAVPTRAVATRAVASRAVAVPGIRAWAKAPVAVAAVAKVAAPVAAPRPAAFNPAKGSFHVQLGAYENAGVARDAWLRMSRGVAALGQFSPYGANFSANGANFYRLSVGGFARGDADSLCRQVRAKGGHCFVRTASGDATAKWARTQVAGR